MLFRDIRNNRRKINESDRRVRTHEDRTGKFDTIICDNRAYSFEVQIYFVTIEITYDIDHEKAHLQTGIDGSESMNNLVRDPELLREIADFMEPLLDQNGKIDVEVLDGILADNDL